MSNSGTHRVDELLQELAGVIRPIVKAPAPREATELDVRAVRARVDAMQAKMRHDVSSESLRSALQHSLSEFRAAFHAAAMSERAFARYVGVSHTFINDILEGRRAPTERILRRMPPESRLRWGSGYVQSVEEEPRSAASWR